MGVDLAVDKVDTCRFRYIITYIARGQDNYCFQLQSCRSKTPLPASNPFQDLGSRKAWPTPSDHPHSLWFGNHLPLVQYMYCQIIYPAAALSLAILPPRRANRCERAFPIEGWQMFARTIYRSANALTATSRRPSLWRPSVASIILRPSPAWTISIRSRRLPRLHSCRRRPRVLVPSPRSN